jgi:MFS family permease
LSFYRCTRGIVNTYGAFQTYYETDLLRGHSPSQIAWIGSIQTFLFLFGGAIAGPLYDHGHFRTLLVVGTFLMVFGMIMVSLCTEYWQFVLAQGITVGIGGACLFVPGIAILPTYFSSHLVFAMGVAGSGSGLGKLLYSDPMLMA